MKKGKNLKKLFALLMIFLSIMLITVQCCIAWVEITGKITDVGGIGGDEIEGGSGWAVVTLDDGDPIWFEGVSTAEMEILERAFEEGRTVTLCYHSDENGNYILDGVIVGPKPCPPIVISDDSEPANSFNKLAEANLIDDYYSK